ncbi:MAG TPA: RodZ domain-containing protein [Arenimonas sp.]|nr:RodZ domain-containing protein [Arenimonas sp.]
MTMDMHQDRPLQNSLFPEPVGDRLRAAREQAGLSRDQVAQSLRLPSIVISAMESDDWQRLGAPIYIRSNLGAYLELLGLPPELVEGPAGCTATPRLQAMDKRSRLQGMIERGVRNVVYLTMTAVIAVPAVWLATHYDSSRKLVEAISLEPPVLPSAEPAVQPAPLPPASVNGSPVWEPEVQRTEVAAEPLLEAIKPTELAQLRSEAAAGLPPVIAAMAGFPRANDHVEHAEPMLRLSFRDESWLEVADAQGRNLGRELVPAGSERQFPLAGTLHVTLGNAEAVDVRRGDESIDIAAFRSANVARFAVSSADVSSAGH